MAKRGVRKRGGQPGNTNALKHGFYSKQFDRDELQDLDNFADPGLQSEITMARVVIRRLLDISTGNKDLFQMSMIVNTLTSASIKLAGMLRTQKFLGSERGDDFYATITQVLADIVEIEDLKI